MTKRTRRPNSNALQSGKGLTVASVSRKIRSILGWLFLLGLISLAALFIYCKTLFGELEVVMTDTPTSQPSIIFSDFFILQKGSNYSDSFLVERLKEAQTPYQETSEASDVLKIEWKERPFNYPEVVLPASSALYVTSGSKVSLTVKEDRVESIKVNDQDRDSIAIQPVPIAQISGTQKTIRNYTKLENIPTKLLQAIIAIEDQRFLEHHGFDVRSLARAIWVNLQARALSQGGSTLTQQLVKNLLGSHQKTVFRKIRELILAILIEARYSKDLILEKYLNEVYVGQVGAMEVHGVSEAARLFYNKTLDQLALAEMAWIAGVIRGPAYYSPYKFLKRSLERKDTVLKKMFELKLITHPELQEATKHTLVFAPPTLANNKAPYFVDYVKSQVLEQLSEKNSAEDLSAAGLRIFTTLDLPLQRRADSAVMSTVKDLEARYKIVRPLRLEGLLAAADPKTGFIRSLVGGRSYTETTFNRVLNMKRQVGSTFKPIVYLAALEKGKDANGKPYTGAYMVDDEPWKYTWGGGGPNRTWIPHNYEKGFRGHITLREAFANSINIPMAKIGMDVGLDNIVDMAHKLGIREALPKVPSLTLGSIELKPIELLQVYSTFANRGSRVDLTTVKAIIDENGRVLAQFTPQNQQVVEAKYIDILNDFMKSVIKEGTAKSLSAFGYTKTAHGKTGTTSFSRDAWFAGFSQGLAVVTWTGFDELKVPENLDQDGAKKFKSPANLTGASAALPSWAKFFVSARPSKLEEIEPPMDSSIEMKRIDKGTGMRAKSACPADRVYEEYFLPDTIPDECNAH